MQLSMSLLGLGLALAPVLAVAIWLFVSPSRSNEKRREDLKTRHIQNQPWDAQSADGRGNR